jgi:hypothetical protein
VGLIGLANGLTVPGRSSRLGRRDHEAADAGCRYWAADWFACGVGWRPRGAVADQGCEALHDRATIGNRVLGDALQCVDAALAHINGVAAKLVDRAGEAISDLALLDYLDLSQREPDTHGRAGEHDEVAESLKQGLADIVLGGEILGLGGRSRCLLVAVKGDD